MVGERSQEEDRDKPQGGCSMGENTGQREKTIRAEVRNKRKKTSQVTRFEPKREFAEVGSRNVCSEVV